MSHNTTNGERNEPSNKACAVKAAATDASLLKPLVRAGYELIPLSRGKKAPRDRNWLRRPYKNGDQVKHMVGGGNVGVRLRVTDLIIDVDPRNFGEVNEGVDPFVDLVLWLGLDPTSWPRVKTGGGGSHYYLTKPGTVSVRESLHGFPGVEFKTSGRQVVAPGSVHPKTGQLYVWDELDDDPSVAPIASADLIELIARTKPKPGASESGVHDPSEVTAMLEALYPGEFREHDRWLEVMMACHHASGGAQG